jgi:flagellar assembly factor FliW
VNVVDMMMKTIVPDAVTGAADVHFAAGLPGFPDAHRFRLTRWGDDDSPFLLMTGVDDPDVGFVLISPFVFYPDYELEIDSTVVSRLGIEQPSDVSVLCIVTLQDRPQDATVNLLGPIVVNPANGEAAQAVQAHGVYETRAPLAPAA